MTGKGSLNHNSRKFHAKNTDPNRTHWNVEYCNEDIKDVYHELFDDALKRYNDKQTRKDRKIDDYYEKIRSGKQEKLFHEVILQIGDKDNMGSETMEGQLAAKILDEYMKGFQERNPTLRVFAAHLHLDEATPHLHIDFIPYVTGSKRGLDTRVSLFNKGGIFFMNGKELLQSMSEIENDLIIQSEFEFHQKKKIIHVKRRIAIAACLCLCLCGTVPILAFAGNDFAHELLYSISPSIAQKLKPINVSCEDNGIEMTVVAAEVNGEKTTILLSMHDKIAKRLDETTDLFDSYSICTPYDQSGGCSLVSYDAGTNTATFMLTIEQTDHILLPGDKITFSVNQLLSKKEHNNFKIEKIDTNNVYSITEFLEEPDIRGGSDSESESIDGDNMLFIKPDEANAIILKKGVAVTGYGIVEGKLHIQVRFSDILNTDNHGYVYLKNEDGKVVNCQSSVAFWDQSHVNSYEEFVFEVSAEELVNYEIWGEFWTCNNAPIEGEWQVTFPVEKNE